MHIFFLGGGGGGGESYAILYKQVTNFGVIRFAVSKFIFELIWFGLVFVGEAGNMQLLSQRL